jgi:hypothetical protein
MVIDIEQRNAALVGSDPLGLLTEALEVLTLMAEQVVEMGDKDGEGGASRCVVVTLSEEGSWCSGVVVFVGLWW